MNNEYIEKNETVEKDNPGFNGNFDTLIPTEEECDKAAQKCISAYKALTKYRKYEGGKDNGNKSQEEKQ